jgi:hypothetical protein
MQHPFGQLGCEPAIKIRKPPLERVVPVQPDRDLSLFPQELWELVESHLGIRSVVENSDAEDEVEGSFPERELEYVRLRDVDVVPGADVPLCCVYGPTEIDSDDRGAPPRGHVREPTHAAADIENTLAAQELWGESGLGPECTLRLVARGGVKLRPRMQVPLETEVLDVQLTFNESRDAAYDRELVALLASELA